jgi:hypothetical protein
VLRAYPLFQPRTAIAMLTGLVIYAVSAQGINGSEATAVLLVDLA